MPPQQATPSSETTVLSPSDEARFQQWAAANRITDVDHPDAHYDYRGYWKATGGVAHKTGDHFPDTFKQHGHPTFSVESRYSAGPNDGGKWIGDRFVPPQSVGQVSSFDDDLKSVTSSFDDDVKAAQAAIEKKQAVPHPVVERILSWLPTAEGLVGGALGSTAGPLGTIGGAALGGAAGEAQRQLINRAIGNQAPATASDAAAQIGTEGAGQGAGAALGEGLSLAAKPVAKYLKGKAAESMIAALGPAGRGTGPVGNENLAIAKKAAPELLKRRFMPFSHQGALQQVGQAIDAADQQITTVMQSLPPGTAVPTAPIVDALQAVKAADTVRGVPVGTGKVTSDVLDEVIGHVKQLGDQMTPDEAVRFRQLLGPLAKWSALNPTQENIKADAYKVAYNGIRSALENVSEDIRPANQEMHFWLNIQRVLEKAAQRPQAPSSGTSGAVIGALAEAGKSTSGVLSAAMVGRYVQRAMRSPGWRFASANMKDRLADAIARGNAGKVAGISSQIIAGQILEPSHEGPQ